jgi:hypothetical protein
MAKIAAKRKTEPRKDPDQFQRFLAARKRGMNESLENFAARFGKTTPLKQKPKSL